MKKIFIVFMLLLVLSSFSVIAKKNNLTECSDGSGNLFAEAFNKHTGYLTYTYFSADYDYLGMEQYDADNVLIIDTFQGTCQ